MTLRYASVTCSLETEEEFSCLGNIVSSLRYNKHSPLFIIA
jgi:hypothetical protein